MDPTVERLRQKITVTIDESLQRDQAYARINTSNDSEEVSIEHAKGTVDHPMSDEDLLEKFLSNATPVIGAENAQRAQKMIWDIDREQDVKKLLSLCR